MIVQNWKKNLFFSVVVFPLTDAQKTPTPLSSWSSNVYTVTCAI